MSASGFSMFQRQRLAGETKALPDEKEDEEEEPIDPKAECPVPVPCGPGVVHVVPIQNQIPNVFTREVPQTESKAKEEEGAWHASGPFRAHFVRKRHCLAM